mmetsp:Transcript_32355/g.91082  ORF Transcript_32355/g.91082 Transcript_32355/m.91082 type:complete len:119 (-) Transcript_32355:560-916(-)
MSRRNHNRPKLGHSLAVGVGDLIHPGFFDVELDKEADDLTALLDQVLAAAFFQELGPVLPPVEMTFVPRAIAPCTTSVSFCSEEVPPARDSLMYHSPSPWMFTPRALSKTRPPEWKPA